MIDTPNPGAKAPRPQHVSSTDERRPDMDHPPAASSETATGFDQATAVEERDARTGTLPGSDEPRVNPAQDRNDPDAALTRSEDDDADARR